MSSYFDQFDREVRTASSAAGKDTGAFLTILAQMEERLKKDSLLFAGDRETPDEVRQEIVSVIALHQVEYNQSGSYEDSPQHRESTRMAAACRTSPLSGELHSLWHKIASLRLVMRYGLVMDNPERAVMMRDAYDKG